MYISGQDAWGGVSGRSRSDVNILAVVNTNTHKVMLISTPRDYYLPLSVSGGAKDKLTHAGIYGVDCSRDTLKMLYGYNIDYYFKLNFSGFEAIIDALGGITVWSDYDFTVDPIKHYVVGDNYLTGLEALAFARERHALPGGDNARGQNQMNVIISVIDKMCSSALLNNYTEVLNSLDGMYITDMPYDVMASLIRDQIDAGQRWDIRTYAVNGTGTSASTYTMGATQLYVMEPNMESVAEAKQLIQATLDGTLE
jgi:LCP family protein required for cell wall assembly